MNAFKNYIIKVPDSLGTGLENIDQLYKLAEESPISDFYTLDMNDVTFVRPYGFVGLVLVSRFLSSLSGKRVNLINLRSNIHQYFLRMNILSTASSWMMITGKVNDEWDRNPGTQNLLELTLIQDSKDVFNVVSRTESIFSRWLQIKNLRELMTSVSELCTNVFEHSQDKYGCILIQKYTHQIAGLVTVGLAVGDLGIGIRGSLSTLDSRKEEPPIYFLRQAMDGKTSRTTGRGGLGLRTVEEIATQNHGLFWIRSDNASILNIEGTCRVENSSLANLPGTQVVMEFRAPIVS